MADEATALRLPPDSARALDALLESLRGRNASPGTVTEYRRNAGEFLAFLADRGVDWRSPDRTTVRESPDEVTLASLDDRQRTWLTLLLDGGLASGALDADPQAPVRAGASARVLVAASRAAAS